MSTRAATGSVKDLGEVAGANSDFILLTEEDSGEEQMKLLD